MLCQSIVDTGIGRRMFVIVVVCGCSVMAVVGDDDESENTGRSISRNILNKNMLFFSL